MSRSRLGNNKTATYAILTVICLAILTLALLGIVKLIRDNAKEPVNNAGSTEKDTEQLIANVTKGPFEEIVSGHNDNEDPDKNDPGNTPAESATPTPTPTPTATPRPIVILDEMADSYNYLSKDIVGYIDIKGINITRNVFQTFDDPTTPENEGWYYLDHLIDHRTSTNKAEFFLDPASRNGIGYKEDNYAGGEKPSDIIMIYGHNDRDGDRLGYMFKFLNTEFAEKNKIIEYKSLYEERKYQVISVFRSHVMTNYDVMDYRKYNDPKFKYYQFTGNLTRDEFIYWFANILSHNETDLPIYDGEYGDEFLVLSTCSTTDETGAANPDGMLCLVAVRIE